MADETRKVINGIENVLKKGAIVRVVMTTDKGHSFYNSKLINIDSNIIYMTYPAQGTREIPIRPGETVRIVYQASDALYEFDSQSLGFEEEKNVQYLRMSIPSKGWRVQRRNFFRLNIKLPGKIRRIKEEKISQSHFLEPYGEEEDCLISNICGGGIQVYSNASIEEQGFFEVSFDLPIGGGPKGYQEVVKVVRKENKKPTETFDHMTISYGCYFFSMDDETREEIIQFVYRQQLDMHKRTSR